MRWSSASFVCGLLGGAVVTALLLLTFAETPGEAVTPEPPRESAHAPEADDTGREEALPSEAAEKAPGRARVDPAAREPREPHEVAPPPMTGVPGGRNATFDLSGASFTTGRSIRLTFSGTQGSGGWIRIVSGAPSDPAPALLAWGVARSHEVVAAGDTVARADAASRLVADTYAERATGLGLAMRVEPPPVELILALARDTGYPDLRGAALLAAAQVAIRDPDVRAAILDLALDGDSAVRTTATGLLEKLGAEGARRAAAILLARDYTPDIVGKLTAPVAANGDVAAFLGASPPPDAALSVIQQLAGRLADPQTDDDRRLAQTLPDLVRPLLDAPEADESASLVLPQLAALGHGAFLRSVATTSVYRTPVRSAAVTAALAEERTRPDGIAAAAGILTDPTADVALARGVLGAVDDAWLDDPTLRGALESAARSHPSAWVRDDARERLARHDPAARGTIVVHEAKYGTGNDWLDVTDEVRGAVSEGRLSVQASNDLKGDPKVGHHKTLRVEYSIGGERRLATVGEGGTLTIP